MTYIYIYIDWQRSGDIEIDAQKSNTLGWTPSPKEGESVQHT